MKISSYINKKDAEKLKANYIKMHGAEAWEKLQLRAKELKALEMACGRWDGYRG